MVVYADTVFAVNFVSAYILLYILKTVIYKASVRKRRLVLSAVIGAGSATLVFCIEMPVIITYALRLVSVSAMLFTAFFELRKQIFKQIMWFLMLGGIVTFSMVFIVSLAREPLQIITKAGIVYFDIPPWIFLILLAVSYLIMVLFIKMFKNRKNKKYYIMSVTHNNKTITVPALFDSGNLLKEPITGKYVNILEWESAKKLFDLNCGFAEIGSHAEEMKLWAVPFKSLGNQSGILFAFIADKIEIPEEKKCLDKSFIGIYEKPLSRGNEYHALINAGLL